MKEYDKDLQEAILQLLEVCFKYEQRPTEHVFHYLLDVVQDNDIEFVARQRSFMALKRHHSSDIAPVGIQVLQTIDREVPEGSVREFLSFVLHGTSDLHNHVNVQFIQQMLQRMTDREAPFFIKDTCQENPDHMTRYKVHRNIMLLILQAGLRYVRVGNKLSIGRMLYQNKMLRVEDLDHLYQHRGEIGDHLYDFFHLLEEPQFIRYRLIGDRFIQGEEIDEQNLPDALQRFANNQHSVHMLDKYRMNLLAWLYDRTFFLPKMLDPEQRHHLQETSTITFQLNNMFSMFNRKPEFAKVFQHVQTLTSCFEFIVIQKETPDLEPKVVRWKIEDVMRRMIWYISHHEDRKELEARFLEEIQEMQGTCVSGHLNRLFNCLAGFEELVEAPLEADYKNMFRELLDKEIKKHEALLDAIVMAEWTDDLKEELEKIASPIRLKLKQHYSITVQQEEEKEWYLDVIYKYAGVKLT